MAEFTPSIIQAIDRGFWPRLMGYISAAKTPNPARVAELAAGGWTRVAISVLEAETLLAIGIESRRAAKSWMTGAPIASVIPPVVPLIPTPNVDGGDPGRYEVGILIQPRNSRGAVTNESVPVVFSSACRGNFEECIQDLVEFTEQIGSDSPSLNAYVNKIVDNWLYGRGNMILPNWLVDRVGREMNEDE